MNSFRNLGKKLVTAIGGLAVFAVAILVGMLVLRNAG
jgi:hypothetical protein